jgi:hypothetical protein
MSQQSKLLTVFSTSQPASKYAPDSVVVRGSDYNSVVTDITTLFSYNAGPDAGLLPLSIPAAAQENITAGTGGPISVSRYFTTINVDGTDDAFTLADGFVVGQLKKIYLLATTGGNGVITPATALGFTTITMNGANDYAVLVWNGSGWVCVEQVGCVIA